MSLILEYITDSFDFGCHVTLSKKVLHSPFSLKSTLQYQEVNAKIFIV